MFAWSELSIDVHLISPRAMRSYVVACEEAQSRAAQLSVGDAGMWAHRC